MARPHAFQEYPRSLHRPDGSTRTVVNDDDKADALAEGWALDPFVDLTGNRFDVVPVADPADDAVTQYEFGSVGPKKKRGRG